MKIVIIGIGAAGLSAIRTILKLKPESEITVISKEDAMPFAPVALHKIIENEISEQQLNSWEKEYSQKNNITFIHGKKIIKVIAEKKELLFDDNTTLNYDKLLIASGASPKISPDLALRNDVFTLRNLDDAKSIKNNFKKRAIIFGAGAVSIKIAVALRTIGVDVILLCRSRLCRRIFDEDISELIRDLLIKEGIKVLDPSEIKIIDNPAKEIEISNQKFDIDGIIAALGVSPNTDFLDSNEFQLSKNGGILVNEFLQTNKTDVYAAGDCIETVNLMNGETENMALWPTAVEQGKIAASNILGAKQSYEGTVSRNVIDVFNTPFVTIGSINGEKITIQNEHSLKRFTIRNNKLIGVQLVNDIEDSGRLLSYIKQGGEWNEELLSFKTMIHSRNRSTPLLRKKRC